jgi:hypothetical protein
MTRGKPMPQSSTNLRAFAEQLSSCAQVLVAIADQMDAKRISSILVLEGHRMAYLSVEQYLEKFLQEVRKAFTRHRMQHGDFGGEADHEEGKGIVADNERGGVAGGTGGRHPRPRGHK